MVANIQGWDYVRRMEIFKHKGRICVVMEYVSFGGSYCNGYVQTLAKNYGKDYNKFVSRIETDELTYAGNLGGLFDGIWFFGFDSAHLWNDEVPESKTFESVKERTKKLAEEMVAKRI